MRAFIRILLAGMLIGGAGCASTRLPLYLQDRGAASRRFYADYEQALQAIQDTLAEEGWQVEKQVSPSVYEQNRYNDLDDHQLLILTSRRTAPGWTGRRYGRLNVYLRSKAGISEVEIRALSVHAWIRLRRYGNPADVKKIFDGITRRLQGGAAPGR